VGKTLETMADVMSRSRQKEIAQEKRESGLEIAPAANQKGREEAVRMERKPEEQQRRQAARGMPAVVSLLAEDRKKVVEVVKALEHIAGVRGEMWSNPHISVEERAKEITAWVRSSQPIAEKLGVIPNVPLDREIKTRLTETFKSLEWMTGAYEGGRRHQMEYVSEATKAAREALGKVRPDLLTWELARSVSHSNGNFEIIEKMIGQGGRVEKLWQQGEPGEQNSSVFTVRNLQGTYTAHLEGMEKTKLGFDEMVNRFGYGKPSDSRKVNEIEYDPIKIRAEQIERQQAQAREIERSQERGRDKGDFGFSR
jgi:hypothetical protein